QGLAGLSVELDHLLLVLLLLQLESLLRGNDVRDPLLDVLEQLDLLLVAVLQSLGRILGPIEQFGDLGFDYGGHAPGQARHRILLGEFFAGTTKRSRWRPSGLPGPAPRSRGEA